MTKQRNPITKLIAFIGLVMIMVFSMALPAFAADYSEGQSADDPAKAVITKVFMLPVNTNTPEATFTFTFTKVGVGEDDDTATQEKMPDLGTDGSTTISFTAGQDATFTYDGTNYLVDQSADILENIPTDGSAWDAGAGIYRYTVTETAGGIVFTETGEEFEVYSMAEYDIEIWVEEDENGVLFARYIVGYYIPGTPDEYYPETPGDGKLDPTPGWTTPGTPDEIGQNYSGIIFTNKYWRIDGDTDPDPDPDYNALEVNKTVAGLNPDYDTYFEFGVTVTTPAVVGEAGKTYNAYIVDMDSDYVDLDATGNPNVSDGTDSNGNTYITFTSDSAGVIHLKHGERLVFFDLEVGSKVSVYETIVQDARVKYSRTFSGTDEFSMPAGSTGVWGFPRTEESNSDEGLHYTEEGAGANIVSFTNTMSGNPPTGIAVEDMPYIVLIGLGIAGLVIYMMARSRRMRADA